MNLNRPHIVIIGAGVSGLTAAFRLNQAGYQTTILEKSTQPGGQLATTELNVSNLRARPLPIEHYYHHVFRGDIHLIKLCDELNIANALEWRDSTMGYYTQNKLHKFGTPLSLLRFTPLSVINRLKFIGSVLRLQFLTSQSRAEQWAAYTWFQKQGYSTVWNIIWKPLFDMKFGEWADRISLVWLWDKLQMRGKSRGKSGNSEQLGYMQGSFKTLCDALSKKVLSGGTQLRLNASIDQILHDRETGKFRIKTSDGDIEADKVICTTSARILERIVPFSEAFQKKLNQYRYTNAICLLLTLKQPLGPFYWTNIGDPDSPFGGVIEHTNWIPASSYGDAHIVYLSRYLPDDHPLWQSDNETITGTFIDYLGKIFPDFDPSQIIENRLFKQADAQPLVPVGYTPPNHVTEIPGLFWTSTHHTYPHDRGINFAIEQGNLIAKTVIESF